MTHPMGRHVCARPAPRTRRGAQLSLVHPREELPPLPSTVAPRARRRARDCRPAPLPARAGGRLRRARARRPPRAPPHQRAPAGGQAPTHRSTAAATRRLPVSRRGRSSALRGQGDEPSPARAVVLLERRPAQDRPAAPGDATDRPHPVHGPARRGRTRAAAHPSLATTLQPARQAMGQVQLREAHRQRALSPARRRAHGARRRRPLHRTLAVGCGGTSCHRGDRDRDPLATVHRDAGSLRPAGTLRARAARRLDVSVLGGDLRGRLPRDRRSHGERHHHRPRAVARSAASSDDSPRRRGAVRGSRRRA